MAIHSGVLSRREDSLSRVCLAEQATERLAQDVGRLCGCFTKVGSVNRDNLVLSGVVEQIV